MRGQSLYDYCMEHEDKKYLLDEWDYEKNEKELGLSPKDVSRGSGKKVYWKCKKCDNSFSQPVNNRTGRGDGCPVCVGKKVIVGVNDLATTNPELLKEWDYEKNEEELGLSPKDISRGSDKKVYWKCKKCKYEWSATVTKRTSGRGCPECSKEKRGLSHSKNAALNGNDFASNYPELLKDWDYEKNDILPEDISWGSAKKKVWWKCSKGHSYDMIVVNRTSKKMGCPYCSGHRVLKGFNDLATTHPDLIREWNFEKNGDITPDKLSRGSERKVWWKCKEGHEYKMGVSHRSYKNCGCPYCSNKKILKGFNDLATTHPDLVREWNYEKNGNLTPFDIVAGSEKKVWWICDNGHEYKMSVSNRSYNNSGCPYCSGNRVLRGFNDLCTTHPELTKEWNFEKNGDLTPDKVSKGSNKKVWWKCKDCGYEWKTVVSTRVHQFTGCPQCAKENKSSFPEQAIYYYLKQVYKEVINGEKVLLGNNLELDIYIPEIKTAIEYDGVSWHKDIERDLKKNKLCKEKGIRLIRIREEGLLYIEGSVNIFRKNNYSDSALEEVLIELFSLLNIQVDVNIERDRQQIYSQYIQSKKENSLAVKFPEITKEWHPTKNGSLIPENISYGSHKKVWWVCDKGHEYEMIVKNRTLGNSDCPYCSNKKLLIGFNDLETVFPEIAKEWHPTKNGDLKPSMISKGNGKYIWWLCSICGHMWEAPVSRRTSGYGCPECGKKKCVESRRKNKEKNG